MSASLDSFRRQFYWRFQVKIEQSFLTGNFESNRKYCALPIEWRALSGSASDDTSNVVFDIAFIWKSSLIYGSKYHKNSLKNKIRRLYNAEAIGIVV